VVWTLALNAAVDSQKNHDQLKARVKKSHGLESLEEGGFGRSLRRTAQAALILPGSH
jgi:hypothetical protein